MRLSIAKMMSGLNLSGLSQLRSRAFRRGGQQTAVNPSATIRAMPFSPSALPWWGWLFCTFGAWVVCAIAFAASDAVKGTYRALAVLIAVVSGLSGFVTAVMAVILFVKWVFPATIR